MKDFSSQKGAGTRKLFQAKKWVSYCKFTFLWGMAEVQQADYLTSADQAIPFLGEPKLIKLILHLLVWGLA